MAERKSKEQSHVKGREPEPTQDGALDKGDEIKGLEEALANETRTSATLRHKLQDLRDKTNEIERVEAERNELLKRLTVTQGMETQTIALPENNDDSDNGGGDNWPTIDQLMTDLSSVDEDKKMDDNNANASVPPSESKEPEWQEMIAPSLIFEDELSDGHKRGARPLGKKVSRLLVYFGAKGPVKFPLNKEVMTIGRSESANIRVASDFISRIHARIVSSDTGAVIEDLDSLNGIKVNSESVSRHNLQHGDIVIVGGKLRFAFVNMARKN